MHIVVLLLVGFLALGPIIAGIYLAARLSARR